jgi:hypothetical protein
VWVPDRHSNMGCLWVLSLVWPLELSTVQTSTQSAFLCYPLANFHKSRISDLTCIFTLHYSDGICMLLLHLLTCHKYCMYQSPALPFQKLSKTSILKVLLEILITRCNGYKKKDIKLFHKFIDRYGLIHFHSPREKQSSNKKYQFL